MTLPINITLPLDKDLIIDDKNPESLYTYMKKLIYVVATQMQQSNESANGTIVLFQEYDFITSSSPNVMRDITYGNSALWARRSNLLTQIWFDITWANSNDSGNILVNSPYSSLQSPLFPYVGVIEPDSITFTAGYTYLTANILPGTNTIQIDQCGSGMPVIPLPITVAGHLRGAITYVGQEFQ